ncbi:hypothetical protein NTE_01872 [Candidatus Nitrososphaera evergladensis SR1]|uniref:Uncharacterized protein n=1 Tax=Candidatus Nitrososphaera evergladensis SR1 TaxID=1459636 RepID=A0A075MT12_9ARCH|nr:hypothetical protein NTE_01872 [Candidatus Nitrososphaera evergladensis SR1]
MEIYILNKQYRYAVEIRHPSWFNDELYDFLKRKGICLVWNQLDDIKAPPIVTTDFIYLRLIGDRSISEHEFGRIQKDRVPEMELLAQEVKKATATGALGGSQPASDCIRYSCLNHHMQSTFIL